MSTVEMSDPGPSPWCVGDRVEFRRTGYPVGTGVVEDVAPQVHVVWVRDDTAGERIMLDLAECEIRSR
ncbi:hypothetical protein [Kocuria nitroreducens]|uniref:hypothetical protein n=1 Tax=Kocuria nitroreducens TaxID=3058914 RepID=UPI0036D7F84C